MPNASRTSIPSHKDGDTLIKVMKNYIVISCFPGGGRENVGTTFYDAAETRKTEIELSPFFDSKFDVVTHFPVDSILELVDIFSKGNITQFDVFSHGGDEWLVIGTGSGAGKRELFFEKDLKSLNRKAFDDDANIYFWGCKTASEKNINIIEKLIEGKTIADSFAEYFIGTTVTGFTGGAMAVPSPDAKLDPKFIHKKGDPVWYKTWGGGSRSYKYEKK